MTPLVFVFSEGNAFAKPVAVVTLKIDAILGAPLIENLLVDSESRRHGRGTMMVRRCEQKAREITATRIFAITHPTNTETLALFKSLGYSEMILLEKKL